MSATSSTTLGLVLLAGAATPSLADQITKVDGTVIDDVQIQEETLAEVSYRQDRSSDSIPWCASSVDAAAAPHV